MEEKYLIWSFEHKGWWRENHSGYTTTQKLAGVYTYEEAIKICRGANYNLIKGEFPNETMVPLLEWKPN